MNSANEIIMEALCVGYKVAEIAKQVNMNRRTLEARISTLRLLNNCRTVTQLACKYKTDPKGFIIEKTYYRTKA